MWAARLTRRQAAGNRFSAGQPPVAAAIVRACFSVSPGCRARAPDPGDHPQGRQGRDHPADATHPRPVGERSNGAVFLTPDGRRLDRHGAGRIARRIARYAGITKPIGPHTLRYAFITAVLDAGVPLRDVQAASYADPRTTMRYDRARTSLDRHATYVVAAYVAGAAR